MAPCILITVHFELNSILLFNVILQCQYLIRLVRTKSTNHNVNYNLVPRLSLHCLPLPLGENTLVAASHVTTCDTNFSTREESTNNFCSVIKRKKGSLDVAILNHIPANTPLKFFSAILCFIQENRNIYLCMYPAY